MFTKGHQINTGRKQSQDWIDKVRNTRLDKKCIKVCLACKKEYIAYWAFRKYCCRRCYDVSKHGRAARYARKWRGRQGDEYRISDRIRSLNRKRKAGVPLTLPIVQQVYEDNIKKYGTLTCYLCMHPIVFRDDSVDHIFPVSRGGTNEYKNLAITHLRCNVKKKDKTIEEYKKWVKGAYHALSQEKEKKT